MSTQNQQNNIEALRLQSPEFLTNHRQSIIADAVKNLSLLVPAEAPAVEKTITQTQNVDENLLIESQTQMSPEAIQFKQDTSVDRIMQSVDAIYEGQGNPLYDQEAV